MPRSSSLRWAACLVLLLGMPGAAGARAAEETPFAAGFSAFSAEINGLANPYHVFFIPVPPNEVVRITPHGDGADYTLSSETEATTPRVAGTFFWQAPSEPGHHRLRLRRAAGGEMILHVFVMVPAGNVRNEWLGEYRIGTYPATPSNGRRIYEAPKGFIEVSPEIAALPISPHFTLGQFLCKQQPETWPKYMLLRPELVLKLEYLLEAVNARGWRTDSFFVMSGYRTPAYNAAIGNVRYSRHVWGGAADIFIDARPMDRVMDDLDGDGRAAKADAAVFYELVDGLSGSPAYGRFVGGLGEYGSTSAHGPFIHVDVRGTKARWGR